jgi:transcription-repair coupling factor (superfamily II helicase)
MDRTTEKTWNSYLREVPQIKSWVSNLALKIEKSAKPVWVKTNSDVSPKWIADLISSSMHKNIYAYTIDDNASDEDIINFDFSNLVSDKNFEIKEGILLKTVERQLLDLGYEKTGRVWNSGEFTRIGDILTIWPRESELPYRLEVFGDSVERISRLDVETRRSLSSVKTLILGGASENHVAVRIPGSNNYDGFFDSPVIFSDRKYFEDEISFDFLNISIDMSDTKWDYDLVKSRISSGWIVLMVVNHNLESVGRIREGLDGVKVFEQDLSKGFESEGLKIMVLTDQEMWGTVKISTFRPGKMASAGINKITPGDYVVHEDHGVALYSGIKEEENLGKMGKYIELKYAQKDRLLVPFSQIKKITKYIGSSSTKPNLTRLSGGEWKRIKKRVTESVRKLAMELLRLYAARDLTKVESMDLGNGQLQRFESDFEYVETEDQQQSIQEVYQDMGKETPMDRLLVGDVGYGKTEVAMRAAFITAQNGRQVAVLAPTTVLVEQHYQVFKDRMEKYGIKVASLSRFLSKSQTDAVLDKLKSGEIDVVIGTHKLLSKDVKFKDLGLLVVDEEQKFGVSQKEKLKKMKLDLHVLSMSATPIPRTLNMALSGVRDISAITTPPPGRIPVKNIIKKFNWQEVVESIKREVERGGQVYFVHNRVRTISFIKQKLDELLPGVRSVVGHGQMSGEQLSKVMRDFNEKKYDVLICSTIIENGLDMPNVNTLIIDRAEMFGLAQLYQLRGRIGRGDRQAYSYFFYHGTAGEPVVKRSIKEMEDSGEVSDGLLWEDARRRLQAIEELDELGSGFDLAQKDLEIRGAGNFLGKQQHGNVNSVGFSLYCRLLAEMVEKLQKKYN